MKKTVPLCFLILIFFVLIGSINSYGYTIDDYYQSAKPGDRVLIKNEETVFYITDYVTDSESNYQLQHQLVKYHISDQKTETIDTLYKSSASKPTVHSGNIFYVKDVHLFQYNITSGQKTDLGRMSGEQFATGGGRIAFLSPINKNPSAVHETPFNINLVDLSTGEQTAFSLNISHVNRLYEIVGDDLYFQGAVYENDNFGFYKINIKTECITKIKEHYYPDSFYHDEIANMIFVTDDKESVCKFSPNDNKFYFVRGNQEAIYSADTNAGIREKYMILRVYKGKVYLEANTYFN